MIPLYAGLSVSDPHAYRERLFALLGGRNPLEVMAQTPSILAGIVRTSSAMVLRTRPFEGRWTCNEVIGHLVDSEWVCGYRLRLILCEENPVILGTNQELWVAVQRHNEHEPSDLVEEFRTIRQFNLAFWKSVTPADLRRTAQHNERGSESLDVMLRLVAGHDISHLLQISACMKDVRRE
jgi:hypothetical protein